MTCEGVDPMPIARGPEPEIDESWMLGRAVVESAVPQPLQYTLDPDYGGTPKALYSAEDNPVMRDDVRQVLDGIGVDNIQYFAAVLTDPESGKRYTNYKAFNIIGLVRAADMKRSKLMGTSNSFPGNVDFDALVIDEAKARGLLLFRLAEKVSAIVVHEKVKAAIEGAGIPGFVFYGPGTWSG
jgi:hypothetical protein